MDEAHAANGSEPGPEIAHVGPHATDGNRNALGQFTRANNGHLETGVYSEKRWAELAPVLRAQQIEIVEAKGFTEADADPVFRLAVEGLVQAATIMHHYFEYLGSTGGPVSPKGRTRRSVEGWSRAAKSVATFAKMLGLKREARQAKRQSTRDWLATEHHDTTQTE